MHLDEEQIQRVLHGEPMRDEGAVRDHVHGCPACRARVAQARDEEAAVHALLVHLDHATPPIDAATVMADARARGRRMLPRAAIIAFTLGAAGAAYALPGSPLRAWIENIAQPTGATRDPAPAPLVTGIGVDPGQRLTIRFAVTRGGGHVRIRLSDDDEVVVQASGGSASFASGLDELLVESTADRPGFELSIPRDAPFVDVHIGERSVLLLEAGRVATRLQPHAGGGYVAPLPRLP